MKPTPLLLTCLIGLAVPLAGLAQPTITVQPQSQTNVVGSTLTLSVEAAGALPFAYEWRKGGATVAGATNTALVFTNLQSSQAGNYTVVITNIEGAVTSAVAFVRVLLPPAITTQPTSFPVLSLGASVSNRVAASGTAPLYYQWRLNGTNLLAETNTLLVIANLQLSNAGAYTAVVTNSGGSVTSVVITLRVDPTFTKITTGAIVTDAGRWGGCAWGDYNNDGYDDLFLANLQVGGQNFLYRNNGEGTFTKISTVSTDGGNSSACVWGDYDNDGFLDLFVTNPGSDFVARPSFLYHNNGDGTFQKITSGPIATDRKVSFDASWADYDRDGYIDLFVGDFGGTNNALYRNMGGLTFVPMAAGPIVNEGGSSLTSAWADYNNDGFLDLFVVNWNSTLPANNFLYRNNGDGTFEKITAESVVNGVRSSTGCEWGDYNNDGFPDLFVCRGGFFSAGTNSLFRNNGNGTFTEVTSGSGLSEAGFHISCAWGDYDNDGFLDLFITQWQQGSTGRDNVLYHNNGDGTFTKVLDGSLVNDGGHGCAWADYDNDGFLDLFVANGDTLGGGPYSNFLYRNGGNTNQWIKLKLVGAVSNRAAIGAKVRVKATIGGNTVWQFRDVSGGSGWDGGQNSLVAHLGLREATNIDTIRIEWPSGIVQEMHNVAANQFLTVTEPARLQALGAGVLRIQSWKGMAFDLQTSTDLGQWSPLTTVTNLTGTLEFLDPETTNHSRRFYRTVLR